MLYHETMIVIRYVLPTFVLALNLVFPVELECLQTELGVFKHKKEEKTPTKKSHKMFLKVLVEHSENKFPFGKTLHF